MSSNKKYCTFFHSKRLLTNKISIITIIFCLITISCFNPLTTALHSKNEIMEKNKIKSLGDGIDFSIVIHRIEQIDEIDPSIHGEADWTLRMYVNNQKQTFECEGDSVVIDKCFTWEEIIQEDTEELYIKMELKDTDPWPDEDDIADISAYADLSYEDKDYDDTTDFTVNRPAVFKRTYNIKNKSWKSEDEENDYLKKDDNSILEWWVTSGNFDGSTTRDENDAQIWFNISIENKPPYPPEKPSGPSIGWQNTVYEFSTKSYDPNEEEIQFGWDWDFDGEVDEITGFYESWQTASIYHSWIKARIYHIRVLAIDSHGLTSEWSEPLKVEINGVNGKSGMDFETWSMGHVYSIYFDHQETQEIIRSLRSGGNIVAAVATIITTVAAASGIPLDISVATALAGAIIRLGVEVLNLMDHGMGIYVRVYLVEIEGWPIAYFAYIWSQSMEANEGESPHGNKSPNVSSKPECDSNFFLLENEYTFRCRATDPDGDKVNLLFSWGDENYTWTDLVDSNTEITANHKWSKKGTYNVKVKAFDEYGNESGWSESLTLKISRDKSKSTINLCLKENLLFSFYKIINLIQRNFTDLIPKQKKN